MSKETLLEVRNISNNIKQVVGEALEEKAEENGQITGEKLREVLGEQFKSLSSLVDNKINDLIDSLVAEGGLLQQKDDNKDNSSIDCNFVNRKENEIEASTCNTEGQV